MNPILMAILQAGMGNPSAASASIPSVTATTSAPISRQSAGRGTLTGFLQRLLASPTPHPQEPMNVLPTTVPNVTPSSQESMSAVRPMKGNARTPEDIGDPVAVDLPAEARALLNAIARPESAGKYDVRYSPKGPIRFTGSAHPNVREAGPHGPSSAAGRYQFTGTTWADMGGGDFTAEMQDRRAWELAQRDFKRRTGKDLLQELQQNGLTDATARILAPTWTSFAKPENRTRAVQDYIESFTRYSTSKQENAGEEMRSIPAAALSSTGLVSEKSPLAGVAIAQGPEVEEFGKLYETVTGTPMKADSAFEHFAKVYGNVASIGPKGGINWESMPRSQNVEDFRGIDTWSDNMHGLITEIDTLPDEGRSETNEELIRIGEDANAYTRKAIIETIMNIGQPDHPLVKSMEEWWEKNKPADMEKAKLRRMLEDILLERESK